MKLEVFADIWCPFAHVGLRALASERDRRGRSDVVLWVRAWPLELVNGAPMDGQHVAVRAKALREQVAPDQFALVDPDHFPASTLPGLALVSRAYEADAVLGERATFLVRDALFEHGQDIADPAVLQRMANELGIDVPDEVDHQRVLADHADGRARGVMGSPHFFGPHGDVFCPALQISRDEHDAFVIVADRQRLVEFVDRCFAA